jgi:hypothetical protein
MLPFGEIALAVGGLIVVLDDLVTYLNGGDSIFGKMIDGAPGAVEEIDKIKTAWQGIKTAVDSIGASLEPVKKSLNFEDISMNSTFVDALTLVRQQLEYIEGAMKRIAALLRGEFKEAVSNLPRPREILVDHNPLFAPARMILPKIRDGFNSAVSSLTGSSSMPTNEYTGRIDRQSKSLDEALTRQAMTVEVTIPINVAGMINAGDLTKLIEEPLKVAAGNMFREALGNARAQQAER